MRAWREALARAAFVLAAGALLLFLLLPLAALLWRALGEPAGIRVITGRSILSAIGVSLATTAVSVVLIALGGTPLAYFLARTEFRGRRLLNTMIELPIVLPPVVAGLALLLAFGRRGLLGGALTLFGLSLPFSSAAVILAQVFVAAPFYIRTAQVRFGALPRDLVEAAGIDGAGTIAFMRFVALPLSAQGLVAGLLLAWARALGEFGATILFAGNLPGRTQTMPLLIFSAFERDLNEAVWTGLLLIVLALAALLGARMLLREGLFEA
jgi:molybdate transport system permease protein